MKRKIKDLATIHVGYTFRSRLQQAEGGDVAVVQMKDLSPDNVVDCRGLVYIYMNRVKEHQMVRKGDLLFRPRGQVTTSAILQYEPEKAIFAAPLLKIRINDVGVILPEYLNWYLSQRDAQAYLTSASNRALQKMVGKQTLGELEVELPDIEQQKNIIELAELAAQERKILGALVHKRELYMSKILMQCAKRRDT